MKRTKNIRLRAHLFHSTVLPALTYASETWTLRKHDERTLNVMQRAIGRAMLGVSRIAQVREGIRSSELRQLSKIRDASAYAKMSKIRWAGHVIALTTTTTINGNIDDTGEYNNFTIRISPFYKDIMIGVIDAYTAEYI